MSQAVAQSWMWYMNEIADVSRWCMYMQSSITGVLDALFFFSFSGNTIAEVDHFPLKKEAKFKKKVERSSHFGIKCSLITAPGFFLFSFFHDQKKAIPLLSASKQSEQFDSGKCSVVHLETNHSSQTQQLLTAFSAVWPLPSLLQSCSTDSSIYLSVTHQKQQSKKKIKCFSHSEAMCCTPSKKYFTSKERF